MVNGLIGGRMEIKKKKGLYMVGTFNDEGEISFKAGKWTYWYENGQKVERRNLFI